MQFGPCNSDRAVRPWKSALFHDPVQTFPTQIPILVDDDNNDDLPSTIKKEPGVKSVKKEPVVKPLSPSLQSAVYACRKTSQKKHSLVVACVEFSRTFHLTNFFHQEPTSGML